MIFPLIDGIAKKENLSIREEVVKMIDKGLTIGAYTRHPEYRRRLDETLGSPAACFVLDRFRDHIEKPENEIRASVPWWIERIRETRPEIYVEITTRPSGERWLGDTFVDIATICRGYSRPRP
jgi:hypothetical protein